jgi:hypothetical protein
VERNIESTHINSSNVKCKRFWAQQDRIQLGTHIKTESNEANILATYFWFILSGAIRIIEINLEKKYKKKAVHNQRILKHDNPS